MREQHLGVLRERQPRKYERGISGKRNGETCEWGAGGRGVEAGRVVREQHLRVLMERKREHISVFIYIVFSFVLMYPHGGGVKGKGFVEIERVCGRGQ